MCHNPTRMRTFEVRIGINLPCYNNEAEYETLITSLIIAKGAGVRVLHVKCDSQLVVYQELGQVDADFTCLYMRWTKIVIQKF